MKKNKQAAMFLSLGMLALGVYGCGTPKAATTEVPSTPENNETAQAAATPQPPASASAPTGQYIVKKGDTLWSISRQTGIYANSFEWPLIFKTDRDQIQDPDLINVGQVLQIQKEPSQGQIQHAIKLASDTPKFVPHVEARSPLPLDYF